MKLLAFDTSLSACSVSVLHGNKISTIHQIAPMQQAKLILSMIDEVLSQAGLHLHELDAIAYGAGPGSFTGIRIASCVAQGLGVAHHKPLIPLSSLAILAQTAWMEKQKTPILVAIDARMQQIYWGVYRANAQGLVELEGAEQVCAPEAIQCSLAVQEGIAVGDGWQVYSDILTTRLGFQPDSLHTSLLPHAEALLTLAKSAFLSGRGLVSAEAALPHYLR